MGRFNEKWPGWYHDRTRWKTRDGVIPHRLFGLMVGALDEVDAVTELRDARAFALGYAMARAGKEGRVKSAVRSLVRRAYPEIIEGWNDGQQ